jgi:RNA polymerase sigma-54 factor
MILKDIADLTGLDISTISRVASAKFVQTEFGVKRLKEFFSESITKQDGEEASTIEVKETLRNIIDSENKQKPYSDDQLRLLLQDRGFKVARRTIAKYREQMNISVGRLRKEI